MREAVVLCLILAVAGWLLSAYLAVSLHFANDAVKMLRANAKSRLTDAERKAVELAIDSMNGVEDISASWSQTETEAIATLRGLLERTETVEK